MNIHIRTYTSKDCLLLAQLFYDTVHTVNARDYTPEQLQAWAPGLPDLGQRAICDICFLPEWTRPGKAVPEP